MFNDGTISESIQTKIDRAKASTKAVKDIEKLEKEIARLQKSIKTKQDKIQEIANNL